MGILHRCRDRVMLPAIELFARGLMTDESALDAYLQHTGAPGETPDVVPDRRRPVPTPAGRDQP